MHALLAALLLLVMAAEAQAQSYIVLTARGEVACGLSRGAYIPGSLTNGRFVSYAQKLRSLKQLLRKARGTKRTKLLKLIKATQLSLDRNRSTCRSGPPIPSPTASPNPNANFDFSGTTTAQGNQLFGIPGLLSGSISAGRALHQAQCSGCHGEMLNRTFSQYRSLISAAPMFYSQSEIPDQSLADLTAYLNRFRQ